MPAEFTSQVVVWREDWLNAYQFASSWPEKAVYCSERANSKIWVNPKSHVGTR